MIAAAGDLPLWQWQSIPVCNLLFLTVLLEVVVWILTTALMICVGSLVRKSNKQPHCPSVTVMRNVQHNNVMFIYQLAGPDRANCIVFVTCMLFIIICKKGKCSVVGMGFTPVASNTHIIVVMWIKIAWKDVMPIAHSWWAPTWMWLPEVMMMTGGYSGCSINSKWIPSLVRNLSKSV
jgi:hypothetical protein